MNKHQKTLENTREQVYDTLHRGRKLKFNI
jgi:hypothetical protein